MVTTRDELETMTKKQLYAMYNAMHERQRAKRSAVRSSRQLGALKSIGHYTKGKLVQYILDKQKYLS